MRLNSIGEEHEPYGPVEQRMDVAGYNHKVEEERVKRYILGVAEKWDMRTKKDVQEKIEVIAEGYRKDIAELNSIRDDMRRQ